MKAINVAKYFLSKDSDRVLFNNNVVELNGRKFYEGNARLNKYLFLSQVVYLAKNDLCLFDDVFLAFDNGPIIEEIMQSYPRIDAKIDEDISEDISSYLDKIYFALENATYEELIEITHEDPEWKKMKDNTYNAPTMNLKNNIEVYKKRYKGLIEALKNLSDKNRYKSWASVMVKN